MIILLDLNYTLVEISEEKVKPFVKQIAGERYRSWLVDLLKDQYVILVTARPAMHQAATLASIESKTGWLPQEAHFNSYGLAPPLAKERMLNGLIFPRHQGKPFFALESNPRTSFMYARHGIASAKIMPGEQWDRLPIG